MRSATCDICGTRPASYLRRSSGEKLCSTCFERVLLRGLRRGLSLFTEIKPRSRFLVYIPPEKCLEGYVASHLMIRLEKKYGGWVAALSPPKLRRKLHDVPGLKVLNLPVREKPILSALESLVNSKSELTKLLPSIEEVVDYIILPYTVTDYVEAGLEYFLNTSSRDVDPTVLSPFYRVGNIPVLVPFLRIQRVDVVAYSILRGLLEKVGEVCEHLVVAGLKESKAVTDLVNEVDQKHTELIFRFYELLQGLINTLTESPSTRN